MDWRDERGRLHHDCAVVYRTRDAFGGLSNMAGGYPLRVNDVAIPTSEALYQACRFPHRPDWQAEIIAQRSGMAAKMKAKKDGRREFHSRPDWATIRVEVMAWALRVKLAHHVTRLAELLQATGDRAIVEQSRSDDFWGAIEVQPGLLEGENQLGRLLMELRDLVRAQPRARLSVVEPLAIPDFTLLGAPVRTVFAAGGP